MKKLSTLFAIAAMSATLGAAGCKTKHTDSKDMSAKPTETVTPSVTPSTETRPGDTKPDDKKPAEAKPMAAADLPTECAEYKASIDKLATCDKLPQATRDALKQSYEQSSTAWASTPAEGRASLGTSCKSATDAVKQAAATACGW